MDSGIPGALLQAGPSVRQNGALPDTAPGAAGAKLQQADPTVNYLGPDKAPFACSHCSYFQGPSQCAKVDGIIDPSGLCKLYEPADDPMKLGDDNLTKRVIGDLTR